MSKTPLHLIMSRLRRMKLDDQIEYLCEQVKIEKPHSIRRSELLALLVEKRNRQLSRGNRRKAAA
jgi:hypothetical protein